MWATVPELVKIFKLYFRGVSTPVHLTKLNKDITEKYVINYDIIVINNEIRYMKYFFSFDMKQDEWRDYFFYCVTFLPGKIQPQHQIFSGKSERLNIVPMKTSFKMK